MESCWGVMVCSDGWMPLSFVKGILGVSVVVVIVLFMFSSLVKCLQKCIGEAFLINKERGVVEAGGPARGLPVSMPWKKVHWNFNLSHGLLSTTPPVGPLAVHLPANHIRSRF